MLVVGLEVRKLQRQDILILLDLHGEETMVEASVLAVEVVDEGFEGCLEVSVGVQDGCCIRLWVKVLFREVDSLSVHTNI